MEKKQRTKKIAGVLTKTWRNEGYHKIQITVDKKTDPTYINVFDDELKNKLDGEIEKSDIIEVEYRTVTKDDKEYNNAADITLLKKGTPTPDKLIKILSSNNLEQLEKDANTFIKDHKITFGTFKTCQVYDRGLFIMVLWYEG